MLDEGDERTSSCRMSVQRSHYMHVIASRMMGIETVYLARLRQAAHFTDGYFVKKGADFEALMAKLHEYKGAAQTSSEASEIEVLPEMPQTGHFGFRNAWSQLTQSTFLAEQASQIEVGMDSVLGQVTQFCNIPPLVDFFTESEDPEQRKTIDAWLESVRNSLTLFSMSGYWKRIGSPKIWTIFEDGTAYLDGRHRGADYDLFQETGNCTLSRTIYRNDGWHLDMDRSSKDKLIWVKPDQPAGQPYGKPAEVVWCRMAKEEAQPAIDEAKRSKEEKHVAKQEREKSRIREAILQRVAAKRADNPDMEDPGPLRTSGQAAGKNGVAIDTSIEGSAESKAFAPPIRAVD